MASDLGFVEYVAEQMDAAGTIAFRKMFGEYAIYCDGKVVALVCDDRLFVKETAAGRTFIGDVVEAPPYPGAKLSFLIEDRLDDREWLGDLIRLTALELPTPPPKRPKRPKRPTGEDSDITFSAKIEAADRGGAYVVVPFDVEATFGKKRVPVQASIDGIPYRGSLVRMGGTQHVLGVLKAIRDEIGKQPGDTVEVVLREDTAPREVVVPADLAAALDASPVARRRFEGLSFSHKREYVTWIEGMARDKTRARRITQTVERLELGEGTR